MELATLALDCLYLNWALPLASAPALPRSLRYEIHSHGEEDFVFVSALLFRLSGLCWKRLPWLRLSYPQMNVRLYVVDGEGAPAVLFQRMLVPLWVVPASRLLARQPAEGARFDYPPSATPAPERWRWRVRRGLSLEVVARPAAPAIGDGPRIGSWERTVEYFRQRPRGYALQQRRLCPISTFQHTVEVLPLAAEVVEAGLVGDLFQEHDPAAWQRPHSAWLCPRIPFVFELGRAIRPPARPPEKVAREGVPAAG